MNVQHHIEDQKVIIRVPVNLRRWGGKKVLVGPQGQDLRKLDFEIRKDEKLLKALGRAYRWHKMLALGKYHNITELSEAEDINKSYLQRVMRMMLLSPRIIDAILNGQQPQDFSLTNIDRPFSPIWEEQEKLFGFTF